MPSFLARQRPRVVRRPRRGPGQEGLSGRASLWRWLVGLGVALVAARSGVCLGSVTVAADVVVSVLFFRGVGVDVGVLWTAPQAAIIWDVRLPRVLLAAAVGAGLAVCGAVLQATVRNVLADPYLLGISSGASTGAAAAILFGLGAGLGLQALPVSAFAWCGTGRRGGVRTLAPGWADHSSSAGHGGVAVGYVLSAATSMLVFSSDSPEGARSVMFWLLGSLTLARWDLTLLAVVLGVLAAVVVMTAWGRRLDALAVGDETALSLGVPPSRLRIQLLLVVSACTGTVVAASGSIGFVGLVLPHLARRLVGASHRALIPVAALLGATFLVLADIVARTLWSPRELPIGIVTALVGAPVLVSLVRRFQPTPN